MVEITAKQAQILDKLYLDEYLDKCVQDLIDIHYSNPYPKKIEDYKSFVIHAYNIAAEYGLDNEKYAFSFILAWHVKGQFFIREKFVLELLKDTKMFAHTKHTHFLKMALDIMREKEQ
jgi:hypothetical protein